MFLAMNVRFSYFALEDNGHIKRRECYVTKTDQDQEEACMDQKTTKGSMLVKGLCLGLSYLYNVLLRYLSR